MKLVELYSHHTSRSSKFSKTILDSRLLHYDDWRQIKSSKIKFCFWGKVRSPMRPAPKPTMSHTANAMCKEKALIKLRSHAATTSWMHIWLVNENHRLICPCNHSRPISSEFLFLRSEDFQLDTQLDGKGDSCTEKVPRAKFFAPHIPGCWYSFTQIVAKSSPFFFAMSWNIKLNASSGLGTFTSRSFTARALGSSQGIVTAYTFGTAHRFLRHRRK